MDETNQFHPFHVRLTAAKKRFTQSSLERKVAPAPISSRFLCPRPPYLARATIAVMLRRLAR